MKILIPFSLIVFGMMLPASAAPTCSPACSAGASCCVTQYPNLTYSAPFCKPGSCYTAKAGGRMESQEEFARSTIKGKAPKAKP